MRTVTLQLKCQYGHVWNAHLTEDEGVGYAALDNDDDRFCPECGEECVDADPIDPRDLRE